MSIERSTLQLLKWRIAWLLFVLFLFQALDRANVGFASLEMNRALGFSPSQYGFGVSVTFIGILLFQIPSVLLMHRIGARRWFGLIVGLWGATTVGLAFIHDHVWFYTLRFLIGVFEGGFSPGLVYYIGTFFPSRSRGVAMGIVLMAVSGSQILASPLSGFLMTYGNVGSFAGWRSLFLFEGTATLIAAAVAWRTLSDTPNDAKWLSVEQKAWLAAQLEGPRKTTISSNGRSARVLTSASLWAIAGSWCTLSMGMFGLVFWLPQVVKHISESSTLITSLVSGIPWLGAAAGTILNGQHSDASGERYYHLSGAAALGAMGLVVGAVAPWPWVALAGLTLAGFGIGAAHTIFWTIPSQLFPKIRVSAAILAINVSGTITAFLSSNLIGWIREKTGSFTIPVLLLAGCLLVGLVLLRTQRSNLRQSRAITAGAGTIPSTLSET